MKKLTFALIFSSLLSCQGNTSGSGNNRGPINRNPAEYNSMDRMNCDSGSDAFKCIRFACQEAGAQYNHADKSCQCDQGQLFAAQRGGICVEGSLINDTTLRFENSLFNVDHYVRLKSPNISRQEISNLLQNRSAPILPGTSVVSVFRTGEEFRSANERSDGILISLASFGMPETYLDGVSLNNGVFNKIADRLDQFYFLPSSKKINSSNVDLNLALAKALERSKREFQPDSIYSVSKLGCAEICVAKQTLLEDQGLKITRIRTYSSGNPISDQVNALNKQNHFIDLSVSLINNQVSHYIQRDDGIYNIYANDGVKLGLIADNRQLENGLRNNAPAGAPVLVFEDGYNEQADQVALLGPHLAESFYGWFSAADNRPFLFGKKTSEWGEDYEEAPEHADQVVRLASQNLRKPIIPFPSVSLINGDVGNKLQVLPNGNLVASVSFGIPYDKDECLKSPIAQTFQKSEKKILWVIGAGNSGNRMQTEYLVACPQVLSLGNTLLVAATAGKEFLASSSTYGETSVDIAESGCKASETACQGSAATSYAAPRAARSIADLMLRYPQHSPQQIRMAVLLTAKVPYERNWLGFKNAFLRIRSGGLLDTQAASIFLNKFGANVAVSIDSKEVFETLLKAKAGQYKEQDFFKVPSTSDQKDLIKEQIERLKQYL